MIFSSKARAGGGLAAALLLLASAMMFALAMRNLQPRAVNAPQPAAHTLVIDPGHGGIDGGAIALNGAKESDINLAIALKLRSIAEFCGQIPVMTRSDDSRRTDFLSYSEHEDLVHRTEIINSVANAVLISIHQNCYPTSQPSGAQVLYSKWQGSQAFGELTHRNIIRYLQAENRRVAEPAAAGLYITANAACPAILVECGFVSNSFDLDKLLNEHYQTAFAAVLMASYLQFAAQQSRI